MIWHQCSAENCRSQEFTQSGAKRKKKKKHSVSNNSVNINTLLKRKVRGEEMARLIGAGRRVRVTLITTLYNLWAEKLPRGDLMNLEAGCATIVEDHDGFYFCQQKTTEDRKTQQRPWINAKLKQPSLCKHFRLLVALCHTLDPFVPVGHCMNATACLSIDVDLCIVLWPLSIILANCRITMHHVTKQKLKRYKRLT